MPRIRDKEPIMVAFHVWTQMRKEEGAWRPRELTVDDIDKLEARIRSHQDFKASKLHAREVIRKGEVVEIIEIKRLNQRCLGGTFLGAYSGHAFRNSSHGRISASDINQRPFHFFFHLLDSGRILVAAQYLGLWGDYAGLRSTLQRLCDDEHKYTDEVIVREFDVYEDFQLKKISFDYVSNPNRLFSTPPSKSRIAWSIEFGADDPPPPQTLNERLRSLFQRPTNAKALVSQLLGEMSSLKISADDIMNVKAILASGRRTATLLLFQGGLRSTRFSLEPERFPPNHEWEGHPKFDDFYEKSREIMRSKVLPGLE